MKKGRLKTAGFVIQWVQVILMSNIVYGRLRDVHKDARVVTIKRNGRIEYFHMPKGLFQTFLELFLKGSYLFMTVSDEKRKTKGWMTRSVESIEKIMLPQGQTPLVFFDIALIRGQIRSLVESERPKLFLDLEMTMPPYRIVEPFESEIIQYGYVLAAADGTVLEKEKNFVKPTRKDAVTDRTRKFLKISQEDVETGIPGSDFLKRLVALIRRERPTVFVWGQNDGIELRKASRRHHLPDITRGIQMVDLLRLHKTFFGLKNDLGLFNAYALYYEDAIDAKQTHDALEDAWYTKRVFDGFREAAAGKRLVDIAKYK
jgi:sporulation inhibitor KapD